MARFLLVLPLAVVPAVVVTAALWPAKSQVAVGLPANDTAGIASRDLDEAHLLRLLTTGHRSGEDTRPPGPLPSAASAGVASHAGTPVPHQTAVRTTTAATGDAARAERVRQDALRPHPRPPLTPYIVPELLASISAANNQSPINLGTLTPPSASK
jgi:hypothetical protein